MDVMGRVKWEKENHIKYVGRWAAGGISRKVFLACNLTKSNVAGGLRTDYVILFGRPSVTDGCLTLTPSKYIQARQGNEKETCYDLSG